MYLSVLGENLELLVFIYFVYFLAIVRNSKENKVQDSQCVIYRRTWGLGRLLFWSICP